MPRHIVGIAILCLFASASAQPAGKPSVRASFTNGSVPSEARLLVEASDAVGLDSLEILWPEIDLSYRTGLAGPASGREFKRSFVLREIFPTIAEFKGDIRLIVTVRNTRGATATSPVAVRPATRK
jgi:hypothetical protein